MGCGEHNVGCGSQSVNRGSARLAGGPAKDAQQPVGRARRVHLPQKQQQQLQRGAVVQADRPQARAHGVARRRAAAAAAQVEAVPIQGVL